MHSEAQGAASCRLAGVHQQGHELILGSSNIGDPNMLVNINLVILLNTDSRRYPPETYIYIYTHIPLFIYVCMFYILVHNTHAYSLVCSNVGTSFKGVCAWAWKAAGQPVQTPHPQNYAPSFWLEKARLSQTWEVRESKGRTSAPIYGKLTGVAPSLDRPPERAKGRSHFVGSMNKQLGRLSLCLGPPN